MEYCLEFWNERAIKNYRQYHSKEGFCFCFCDWPCTRYSTADSFVCFTLLSPSVDSSREKDVSKEIPVLCDEGHHIQTEQGTSMNPTSCTLSAICPSTLDWGRGIQKITTYQLWGVCVRKVCVMPDAYCEEVFRFKPWRSYWSFHLLECTSVKAFILQTCCVQDRVAECSMTENCYLLLTVLVREQGSHSPVGCDTA
jgi:hypothetical protein